MDSKLREVSQVFERFKASLLRNDFKTCDILLCQLKVSLTGFPSLPPRFEDSPDAVNELMLAREIYEHAVILSMKTEDQEAFERDFFQLKPYYTDARGKMRGSAQERVIVGLNLLRLLVQNRIAEFHTELEVVPLEALEDEHIRYAIELEQSFMEGAYNRVLTARQRVPHPTYSYFMEVLAKTVRDEIAACSEKAYDSLSLSDLQRILLFPDQQGLFNYVMQDHPEWQIDGSGMVILKREKQVASFKEIPSLPVIKQTLSYARELERIV